MQNLKTLEVEQLHVKFQLYKHLMATNIKTNFFIFFAFLNL